MKDRVVPAVTESASPDGVKMKDFRRMVERSYDMEISDRDVIDGSMALPIGLVQIVVSGYAAVAFGFLQAGRDLSGVAGFGLLIGLFIGLASAVWSGLLLFAAIGGRYAFLPEARILQEFHEDCVNAEDPPAADYFWAEYERLLGRSRVSESAGEREATEPPPNRISLFAIFERRSYFRVMSDFPRRPLEEHSVASTAERRADPRATLRLSYEDVGVLGFGSLYDGGGIVRNDQPAPALKRSGDAA